MNRTNKLYTEGTLAVQSSLQNLTCRGRHPDSVPFSRQLIEDMEPDASAEDASDESEFSAAFSAKDYVLMDLPTMAAKYGFEEEVSRQGEPVYIRDFDPVGYRLPLKPNSEQTVSKIRVLVLDSTAPKHRHYGGSQSIGYASITVRFGNLRDGAFFKFTKWTVRKVYWAEALEVPDDKGRQQYNQLGVVAAVEPDVRWLANTVMVAKYATVYNIRCRLYSRGFTKIR